VLPLVACGGDITGPWDLDTLAYEGAELSFPQVVSDSYTSSEGYTYAYEYSIVVQLDVASEEEGELTVSYSLTYSITDPDGGNTTSTEEMDQVYSVDISAGKDAGAWLLKIDEMEFNLDCALDGDELDCEDPAADVDQMLFTRG
jgi:hypothetical protein